MNFATKTVRTFTSSGPGQSQTVETRTTYGADGTARTETTTRGGGGGGQDGGFGVSLGDANSRFGQININVQGNPANMVRQTITRPLESRYSRGWGSRKADTRARAGLPPMKLEGKTYAEIKQQCQRESRMFEDPDFPALDSSIFYSRSPPRPFIWKRPTEICSAPKFISEGASRFDVQQGELGDCWLLAAVAGLCQHERMFYRVVPNDQDFSDGYSGIFRFQFWQYGKWEEVVIDDRLPTYNNKLVFMHSIEKDEFWSPLLEKAYAKLVGSYEALKGGATSEAMEDFTGGVTENYDLAKAPPNLFHIMEKAHKKGSLMGCSIDADPNKVEAELSNGLIMGHAYTVTCATLVDIQTSRMKGKIPMLRIRNPWGNEAEWKGAWSDKSPEWKFISADERKEIGLTFDDDGEFWMAFSDFLKNFQKLELCNLGPDSEGDTSSKRKWEGTNQEGSWRRRVNAGGCRNYLETFWTNPQYRIDVEDPDEDDDEDMGTLIVALMQKGRRKLRKEGMDLLTMGYAVYSIKDESQGPLDMRYFKYNASVAKSPNFINTREICGRHKLKPGKYCIIPSTFEPQQPGDFLLRIYSEKPAASSEIDEETGISDVQPTGPTAPSSEHFGTSTDNSHDRQIPSGPRPAWGAPGSANTPSYTYDPSHRSGPKPVIEIKEEGGKRKKFMSFKFFDSLPFGKGIRGGRLNLPEIRSNFFSGLFKAKEPKIEEAGLAPVNEAVVTAVHVNRLTGERSFIPGITPDCVDPSYWDPPRAEVTEADTRQDQEMKEAFRRVSGSDMEIDAYELKEILDAAFLKEFRFDGFSNDTCRSMVAMMDDDRSGKLGFEEFKKLWTDVRLWKTVFKMHDKDKSGNFNSYELRHAFHSSGFRVSNGTFNALVQRYTHRDGKIYFDDFIHCVVRMKTMFEIFNEMKRGTKAEFSLDEFIQTTMYS